MRHWPWQQWADNPERKKVFGFKWVVICSRVTPRKVFPPCSGGLLIVAVVAVGHRPFGFGLRALSAATVASLPVLGALAACSSSSAACSRR